MQADVQGRLYAFQDEAIEAQLNTVIEIKSSASLFEEIESLYKLDILKENIPSNIVENTHLNSACNLPLPRSDENPPIFVYNLPAPGDYNTRNIKLNPHSRDSIASVSRLKELTGVIPD